MRNTVAAALASVVLVVAAAPDAHANGRFPESNAIFFAPNDAEYMLLRTTFGMLSSRDRGKTFDWICERGVGLAGVEDPMYSITPDDSVIASTFQGLTVSNDRSCNYAFVEGALKDLVFIDLTSRPSTPETVVAFASSYAGQNDAGVIYFKSTLFETKDQGKSFAPLGPSFDPTLLGETVDLTPSDPDRIYVSAIRSPGTAATGVFLTSRDHGKTWEENALALINGEHAPFIAAVDPLNAERVYVRTSNASDQPSRLLVSDDAGKSFKTIFTGQGQLPGFALSADGTKIWLGGPLDGLRVASTSDFVFTQKSTIEISCLKLASDGLWACSNERSGFVLGLSQDEGATFAPMLHFCDIRGPLECAPGSKTHTECTLGGTASNASPPWPGQRALLGCGGGVDPDAGPTDGGSADGSLDPPNPNPPDDGCGCSLRGSSPGPVGALLAAAAATVAVLRRRRARSDR